MTGADFKVAIKAAGYTQKDFAERMGVHRTTIGDRFSLDEVEPYWIFALAGLVAADAANKVVSLTHSL